MAGFGDNYCPVSVVEYLDSGSVGGKDSGWGQYLGGGSGGNDVAPVDHHEAIRVPSSHGEVVHGGDDGDVAVAAHIVE